MPLYIYSLVRRGVTPEINALSTVLLLGSIGLVGLSQTAQSGGALYTRAMSVGASFGISLYGLFSIPTVFINGSLSIGRLLVHIILLLGFILAWRSFKGYREELVEANTAGKVLSALTVFIVAFAAYFSTLLMLT